MTTILSAVIGIFIVSLLSGLSSTSVFYGLILLIIILVSCLPCITKYHRCFHYLIVTLISFLLGFSYSYIKANLLLEQQLEIDLDSKSFVVEGVVNSLIKEVPSSISFDFAVKHLYLENKDKSLLKIDNSDYKKIRLSYYLNSKPKNHTISEINTGDYWQFSVKLKRPRGFVNPLGFDYQAYLLAQGLSATGYIKKSENNKKSTNYCHQFFLISISVNCLRANLNSFLNENFKHSPTLGMLKGLLTGDKQSVTKEQWDTLKNTGTIHLLAISGLHIGLAASIGFFLGKFFRRLLQLITHNTVCKLSNINKLDRYIPSITSILFALIYSLLAGFSLPTQRALIMLTTFHFGLLFYRKSKPWFLWCTALFLTALLDPLAIYNQGFWLSFTAVAVLIFVFNGYMPSKKLNSPSSTKLISIGRFYNFLLSFSKAQWAVAIGLLLPSLLLLKGVSGLGFIANFIAIPLVSLVTVPLILIGFLMLPITNALALAVFSLADRSISLLFIALEYIEQLGITFWSLSLGDKPLLALLIATAGIVYCLLPRGIPARWLGGLCAAPLFLTYFFPYLLVQKESPALEVVMFDVGQGTAIIVETANSTLIYDAGKHYSPSFDVGEHILSPYLIQKRRVDVDMLMVSHNDGDHAGGVNGLLKKLNIEDIYAGELTSHNKIAAKQCKAGQQWQWDGVNFMVVWPTTAMIAGTEELIPFKANNLSCVLLISYKSYSILLAGDIEKSVESQLIAERSIPTGISLLLAPHHGSKTSSHPNWVDYVRAANVVFSAGYKNPYGHPDANVERAYQASGSKTFNTAGDGAIKFSINKRDEMLKSTVTKSRDVQKRYWYD